MIVKTQYTPVQVNNWEGWSTTTTFAVEDEWPGGLAPASLSVDKIVQNGNGKVIGTIQTKGEPPIDVIGTMPGAVPWAVFNLIFGAQNRLDFLTMLINSCNGSNTSNCCIIVQPINKFPDEIKKLNSKFDMINDLCKQQSECTDINSPEIVATYNEGIPFPAYFIVPFNGCGGDCSRDIPDSADCFNSCIDDNKIVANFNYYQQCDTTTIPEGVCKTTKWLSDNNYKMSNEIENNFISNNYFNFTISSSTCNGRNVQNGVIDKIINQCSGKNMHIDIGLPSTSRTDGLPYWCDRQDTTDRKCVGDENSISLPSNGIEPRGGPLAPSGGSMENTFVRYMFVPGNIFGNFDILASDSKMPPMPVPTNVCSGGGGGGGNVNYRCGKSYNDTNLCTQPTCLTDTNCNINTPHCYNMIGQCTAQPTKS